MNSPARRACPRNVAIDHAPGILSLPDVVWLKAGAQLAFHFTASNKEYFRAWTLPETITGGTLVSFSSDFG